MSFVAFDGRQVVAKAGVPVALLSSEFLCKVATVTAEFDNTGVVVLGSDTVVAARGSRRGVPLLPGKTASFRAPDTVGVNEFDVASVFIDAEVDGDGVHFGGVKEE